MTTVSSNKISVFKNYWHTSEGYETTIQEALNRVKTGKSKAKIDVLRAITDEEKAKKYKIDELPNMIFSGLFKTREDVGLVKHSGFVVMDFDGILNKDVLATDEYVYACWVSPRGNGTKALIRIADGSKHRLHYAALLKRYPEADPACCNESRICFESWDPEIFINENAKVFCDIIETKIEHQKVEHGSYEIFLKVKKWIDNKGQAFSSGSRNIFLFKVASACCRFGIYDGACRSLLINEYLSNDPSFTEKELDKVIKNAYKKNAFGSASFDNDRAYVTETTKTLKWEDIADDDEFVTDVTYGKDVKKLALDIYDKGYESAETTHIPMLDKIFKFKRKELTILTGIGNHGKSEILFQLLLIKTVKEGKKWACFAPESNPAEEYYHNLTESFLGMDCTPANPGRVSREEYDAAYDFVASHFFFVHPKELAPTPEYVKQTFLKLVMKEKVDGCVIDPFNQLTNDYKSVGGRDDKYLEVVLSDFLRFAQQTNVFFIIIAHPHKLTKENGSYPAPDVFDLSGGAMWNNKADNILVYHRPDKHLDPTSTRCEFLSRKIRRQRIVGRPGIISFDYMIAKRRFYFDGITPLGGDTVITPSGELDEETYGKSFPF